MYVCGPTLYDFPHIGNARPLVVFDTLYRLLKELYPNVFYVRNVTDIDDKIINKSKETGLSLEEVVAKYYKIFQSNLKSLNCIKPNVEPFVTDHIKEIIDFISLLLKQGYAYENKGNIFFNTTKLNSYGELSGRVIANNLCGYGNDSIVKDMKLNQEDFVLWKSSKPDEPYWDSPFGRGRPGWHTECTVLSYKYLGKEFDIHGGGSDLLFPHHENERAQTIAAFGCNHSANIWMHNAFININDTKMSKSLGNIVTINDILNKYQGEVLRLAILLTHYRHPIDFTDKLLEQAKIVLDKIYNALKIAEESIVVNNKNFDNSDLKYNNLSQKFILALLDDLNTPLAISELQKLTNLLNKTTSENKRLEIYYVIKYCGSILGLLNFDTKKWFSYNLDLDSSVIDQLIKERNLAKYNKDYATADKIRDKLLKLGISLEDTKNGTIWKKI
ncbi:UNVERIFIED_CONTAM: hypothetical protein PYX00_010824 [Menopon gallinae]|uniref:Cysteine--tRNA ligase, cytoplasmic n=1 Tax=Menopon gallinae TaxID=328185 RepID=A0AAW2H754_9NEOP